MNRIEELKKVIKKAHKELSQLETAQTIERNKAFVGKCYKYRNSYGSGSKWWLYKKVIKINEYGQPVTFEFEMTSDNTIEIRFANHGYFGELKEISQAEFTTAWNNLLDKINSNWELVNL